MNGITLTGNLTRDPELRFTSTQTPVVNLGLAVNRRYTNGEGKDVEEVMFIDLVAWRDLASNVAASLSKGDRVIISGRVELHTFNVEGEDKPRSKHRVIVDSIGPDLRFAQADVKKIERQAPVSTPETTPAAETAPVEVEAETLV